MYFNVHCTFIHYFIHIFTIVKVIFDTLITLISLKCKRDEDDNLSQSDFVFVQGSKQFSNQFNCFEEDVNFFIPCKRRWFSMGWPMVQVTVSWREILTWKVQKDHKTSFNCNCPLSVNRIENRIERRIKKIWYLSLDEENRDIACNITGLVS